MINHESGEEIGFVLSLCYVIWFESVI
jgi:hypothetical protein